MLETIRKAWKKVFRPSINLNRFDADILIFGDSVMNRVSDNDDDKRSLGKMIADELKTFSQWKCKIISGTAYHPALFYHVLSYLSKKDRLPKLVVYPINLRCFSPQWDLNPLWQFDEEIKEIENTGILRNHDVEEANDRVYRSIFVNYPSSELKTIGQFRDVIESKPSIEEEKRSRKKEIFTFHYTHPLVSSNRRLQLLKSCVGLLDRFNVKSVVYITPINYLSGERHIGSAFTRQVNENVNVIIDHNNSKIFDWSDAFESEYFFNDDDATEHLNEEGRKILSHRIVEKIKNLFD